jgi:hypothetical protein
MPRRYDRMIFRTSTRLAYIAWSKKRSTIVRIMPALPAFASAFNMRRTY